MDVAPDFFAYFRRMSPLFDSDPSLYCVSAWNDNGQSAFVASSTAVYRTDCFPGLGWMWSRERWNELHDWTWGLLGRLAARARSAQRPQLHLSGDQPRLHVRQCRHQRGPVLRPVPQAHPAQQRQRGLADGGRQLSAAAAVRGVG